MAESLVCVSCYRDPHGRLVLEMPDGHKHIGIVPVRAFPISASSEGLSLLGADGHECLWLTHLDQLNTASREVIQEELRAREFTPEIIKIVSVSGFSTPSTWSVETDHGPAQLVLRAEEDIRRLLGRTRLLVAASDGVHFIIPDATALDKASRKILDRFL
jgi:hypothetical protein